MYSISKDRTFSAFRSSALLQFFEWGRVLREIWIDGGALPKDPDPKWLANTAIGKLDGDIFVVDSVGFDERIWIDHFGNPHSEDMHQMLSWREHIGSTIVHVLDFIFR